MKSYGVLSNILVCGILNLKAGDNLDFLPPGEIGGV